jgi:hypothetical protein
MEIVGGFPVTARNFAAVAITHRRFECSGKYNGTNGLFPLRPFAPSRSRVRLGAGFALRF